MVPFRVCSLRIAKKKDEKEKKITLSEEINVEFATKKMYFLTPTARCMFIATSYLERKPKYYIII